MGVSDILVLVDREIHQLKRARALLAERRAFSVPKQTAKKRNLTPEGRRRIVAAVKRRWAKQKRVRH